MKQAPKGDGWIFLLWVAAVFAVLWVANGDPEDHREEARLERELREAHFEQMALEMRAEEVKQAIIARGGR